MAKLIKMPEIAANATSAVIVQWSRKEGEAIKAGECLAEIETDKAVIEYDADSNGVLGKILAAAGQEVDVGAPIAVLFEEGETQVDIAALLAAAGVAVEPPPGAGATVSVTATAATTSATTVAASAPEPEPGAAASGRIFASPLARRLAQERGLALAGMTGSGPHGRIVRRDVEAAAQAAPATAANATAAAGRDAPLPPIAIPNTPEGSAAFTDIPHSGMRRTIARRLSESKASIPHFYLSADCRMDKLLALRAEINAAGIRKISVNDFIVKAVAAALQSVPDMNVSWTEAALRKYQQADISVAVSTEGGLITPVVRNAGNKTLSAISREIVDLAARARSGALVPNEYQGGSFTVSNLGMFGVREFSAIINPPQAAILAVGATLSQPVVVDGQLAVAQVMKVTLSVDHRAVDGALAAQWLAAFQRCIENPLSALI
ncbi:pyruvate dehydrogenase complex dihydrolipoamide acetyltransferase [Herbaspirillum sp. AP02]|uniref:pyruvate dehydrogenase complex dihydrolipoamide acetyltransferase n=1 Tax=unclassified Herbaspirillum TaxID=2624150 RepID=UPI0015DB7D03|nr:MULTISPECIES: pyruvate dehydrogenase complex dihydrolipoamide acetyltransferase [unclassified Herbaspirillum]MBG7620013.1 pyruvate dehydrogenase complex dihydrolipoamide acetyltransferase [Herbaspirillum sp. AP02]NZD69265.1 pyruvate dehydrogenase complex dihydrolipoamide acetyltransferase [Herbaspirillum sp. AP21]